MEIFVDVEGFESYKISNHGNVIGKLGRILRNQINTSGYDQVILCDSEFKKHNAMIHRMVAKAFLPNPNGYNVVNHIDGNKRNNKVNNLEWCTSTHNNREAFKLGLNNSEHKVKAVQQIDLETGEVINTFPSMTDAIMLLFGRTTSTMVGNLSNAANGRRKQAYGYKWRKLDA